MQFKAENLVCHEIDYIFLYQQTEFFFLFKSVDLNAQSTGKMHFFYLVQLEQMNYSLILFHFILFTYIIRPQAKKHPKNEEQLVQASPADTWPKFKSVIIINKTNPNTFILLKKKR